MNTMIIVNCKPIHYVVRTRTNRRVRWEYSIYEGSCWDTIDEIMAMLKERYPKQRVEYRIDDLQIGKYIIGFVD